MNRICGLESWVGCRLCAGVTGVGALYRLPGYVGVPLLAG